MYAKFRNHHINDFVEIDNDSVFKLTRGCLSGLETFKSIEERLLTKEQSYYEQSMICTAPFCTILEVDRDVVNEISQNLKLALEEKYQQRHKYLNLKLNSKISEKRKFKILYSKDLVSQKLEKNKDYMIENKIIIRRVYKEVKKENKFRKVNNTPNEFRPSSVAGTRPVLLVPEDQNNRRKLRTKERFLISSVPFNKPQVFNSDEETSHLNDNRHFSNKSYQNKFETLCRPNSIDIESTPRVGFNISSLQKKQDDISLFGSAVYFRKSSAAPHSNLTSCHSSVLLKEEIPNIKQKVKVKIELRDLIHNKVDYKKILDDWSNQKLGSYSSGSYKLPLFSNIGMEGSKIKQPIYK